MTSYLSFWSLQLNYVGSPPSSTLTWELGKSLNLSLHQFSQHSNEDNNSPYYE